MKVALVYDRVNKWGGAERVLLALHELFPAADLFTSVYNPKKASWAKAFTIRSSFLQKFPFASSYHEFYAPLMPFAFESFSFNDYDIVISITSEAAKGIIVKPPTLHICYCLTPTRYLWSGYRDYFRNPLFASATKPLVSYLRRWDLVAAKRPDAYIAISKEVQKRVQKYYKRLSKIIYPPLMVTETLKTVVKPPTERSAYFLVVSRLVPYKRIDLAISACNYLKFSLKIVGTGLEFARLKAMAGPTIEFLGNLTDDELVEYYKGCTALIFPGKEDFGLAIIEAGSFGKPVIAYKAGGALETIIEGKTGIFFFPQKRAALIEKLIKFNPKRFDQRTCRSNAVRFGKEKFKKNLIDFIRNIQKEKNNT